MNIEEMEASVHYEMYDFLNDRGFYFQPQKSFYRKITPYGFQNIHFDFYDYGEDTMMNVFLEIRFDEIEELISPFVPPRYSHGKDTPTVKISVGKLNRMPFTKFVLSSLVDIEHASHSIKQIMLTKGIEFLEHCKKVEEVDRLINTFPDRPSDYVYPADLRCFKGIAAAKVSMNKNFNELGELYLEELKKMNADQLTIHAFRNFILKYAI